MNHDATSSPTATGGGPVCPAPAVPAVPDHEMIRIIGRGRYGEVWLARNIMGAYRAVKVVYRGSFVEDRPFEREFDGIRKFEPISRSHPTQLNILHLGRNDAGGYFYYVMELADDQRSGPQIDPARYEPKTLRHALDQRGRLSSAECLEIVLALATALERLHGAGLIHRDIKPANVIFVNGLPKLADVELVAAADAECSFVGTEGFVPLEGPGKPADLFALGKVLYEMCTGLTARQYPKLPDDWAASPQHEELNELNQVVLRACEGGTQRRYQTAADMRAELELLRNRQSILRLRQLEQVYRRWRLAVRTVVPFLAMAALGLGIWFYRGQRDLRETLEARRQAEVSLAEALLREGQALAANHRPAEARDRIEKSRRLASELKITPLPAELSLADLYQYSPPSLMTLKGHRGGATCVAVSVDQRHLYSGGRDGTIRVWSCPLGRQEAVWDAHAGGIACLALSPDSRFCVSGGTDKKIRIWDTRTTNLVRTIEGHQDLVSALDFAPNGDSFASASWDRTIRIWRLSSGEELQVIQTDFDRIPRIDFSPDGGRILAGSESHGLGIWKLDDPARPAFFAPYYRGVCAAFAPDHDRVLHGSISGVIAVTGLADSGRDRATRLSFGITDVTFLPGRERAIVGAIDGSVAVLDLLPNPPVIKPLFAEHEEAVTAVAAFADGRLAASSSEDGTVRVWDTFSQPVTGLEGSYAFSSVTFSPDGLLLLSAGHSGSLQLWDADTGQLLRNYPGHEGVVLDAAFAPDGRRIASCGQDGTVRIWDMAAGMELRRFSLEKSSVCHVSFSSDGKFILAGEGPHDYPASWDDGSHWFKLYVWEADTGREICSSNAHRGGVFALTVSPDGHHVLTGGGDGKMKLWDTASWQELRSIDADPAFVASIAFSPDGAECVSAGSLPALKVWNLNSGREISSLDLKELPTCLYVGGSNSLMLVGLKSGNLRLWDLASRREMHRFNTGHGEGLSAVALAPNGKLAVSASKEARLRLWDLDCGAAWHRFGEAASKARSNLQHNVHDGAALRALADWYQFRGLWDWACQLFEQARADGADVPSLPLARCYWLGKHLEQARHEIHRAASQKEAPDYYLQLCLQVISRQMQAKNELKNSPPPAPAARPGDFVCQPGPSDGKDIWTTSRLSCAPGGDSPGGGKSDDRLRVGGWGDTYLSLLQFDLSRMPAHARSAVLYLFCYNLTGGGIPLYLDRITQPWDWKTSGTGRDHERLWWADRPAASPWQEQSLPTPVAGQWCAIDITDLYNAWQSGVWPNFGVQLRPKWSANEHFDEFYSSRSTNNPSLRPNLVVTPK